MRTAQQARKAEKNFWCQGKVSLYDEKTRCGRINGFDRHEYGFSMDEWTNKNEKPRVDMIVNFEIKENEQAREAVSIKIR
jgi:hypothetical protein